MAVNDLCNFYGKKIGAYFLVHALVLCRGQMVKHTGLQALVFLITRVWGYVPVFTFVSFSKILNHYYSVL